MITYDTLVTLTNNWGSRVKATTSPACKQLGLADLSKMPKRTENTNNDPKINKQNADAFACWAVSQPENPGREFLYGSLYYLNAKNKIKGLIDAWGKTNHAITPKTRNAYLTLVGMWSYNGGDGALPGLLKTYIDSIDPKKQITPTVFAIQFKQFLHDNYLDETKCPNLMKKFTQSKRAKFDKNQEVACAKEKQIRNDRNKEVSEYVDKIIQGGQTPTATAFSRENKEPSCHYDPTL